MKQFLLTSMLLFSFSYMAAAEIRAYIENIDGVRSALLNLGAIYKSEYEFTDYIYQPQGACWNLNQQFIRLRVYEKTQWAQKKCVLICKMRSGLGVTGKIVLHKEFDLIDQAQQDLDDYSLLFSFHRDGWQYSLDGMQIFVEDIENLNPTIEIVASDKYIIEDLFARLSITDVMKYSVPYTIQEKISKNN